MRAYRRDIIELFLLIQLLVFTFSCIVESTVEVVYSFTMFFHCDYLTDCS